MKDKAKVTSRRYIVRTRSNDANVVKIRTENNGWGALKALFVAVLLAIQIALLLCLQLFFLALFKWYIAVSFALSLITSVYVISTDRNGNSKAVWILVLLLGASFGFAMYWLSDEKVFFSKPKKRYNDIFERTENYRGKSDAEAEGKTASYATYLKSCGNFISYGDSAVKYFPSGAQLFDDMLERLSRAEKFIFIEYFIIADGVLFNRVMDVLEERRKAGVTVRVVCDDMGCNRTLSRKAKKRMRRAGIELKEFNRMISRFSVALNYRDHRKIVVIDGLTAYTGGSNLADEYINEKRMHGYWKDTGVRVDGRATDAFTLTFLRQWEFIVKPESPEDYAPYLNIATEDLGNGSTLIPFADGPDYDGYIGKGMYSLIAASAEKKLYIMSPYFIPDEELNGILIDKARSGVDVRLILPGIPDKAYVYAVSRNNAERLIDHGVKLYCMKSSFVHSKIVMNENVAMVGSINIDLRSFFQQFENAVVTDDVRFLSDIEDDFLRTFEYSELITDKNRKRNSFWHRAAAGFLRLFAPLM